MNNEVKKISEFRVKHFDNISKQLSLRSNELVVNGGTKFSHELQDQQLNNFYEIHVDGVMLIKYIWKESRYLGFLSDNNGPLGVYSKANDQLIVNSLLGQQLNRQALVNIYKESTIELTEEKIELLLAEYNNPKILIYGCKICGDRGCGGIYVEVQINNNIINWKIGDDFEFNFNLEQYTNELNRFLKDWKKA